MNRQNNRTTGSCYEREAFDHLKRAGLKQLETNYYCRLGEIDGIFEDNGTIVFVEVKFRRDDASGEAAFAVDSLKQKKISRCALFYITEKGLSPDNAYRFDVVAIDGRNINRNIKWIKNAFDFIG